jgi:hypothetical protein
MSRTDLPSLSKFLREDDFERVRTAEAELLARRLEAERQANESLDSIDIDSASDIELRAALKELIRRQRKPPPEPVGLDQYSHLPVFLDRAECPRCSPFMEPQLNPETGFRHYVCHDCGGYIAHTDEFKNRGIESATVDHLHMYHFRGVVNRIPAFRELCIPCYRLDWAKRWPDKKCDI